MSIDEDPGTGPEGTQIDLTSTVSDPGDDVITRAWSVTKNGGAFASDNGPAFSFTADDGRVNSEGEVVLAAALRRRGGESDPPELTGR